MTLQKYIQTCSTETLATILIEQRTKPIYDDDLDGELRYLCDEDVWVTTDAEEFVDFGEAQEHQIVLLRTEY